MDKTEIGSPYRILDQKTRAAKADKTFGVLSTLSKAVGGIYQLHQQDHSKEMERRAKNDLVNDTINPDLQLHERSYAETVAKGQALNTFHDMKSRINSGEFDNSSPEDFQEYMNEVHSAKAGEYAPSTYSSEATSAWNDFWVNQEATLTAGQAGRYRVALQGRQADELGQELVTMKQNGYTPEELLGEIESEKYSMLSSEDRRAIALEGASLLAANGDDSVLMEFNKTFDFQNDPKYAKLYNTALKVADRKQRMIMNEGVAEVYHSVLNKADLGELTWDDYDADVTQGIGPTRIKLNEALDSNGNLIVPPREFGRLMQKSQGALGRDRVMNQYTEAMLEGVNLYNVTSAEEIQEVGDKIFRDILQKNPDDPNKAWSMIGETANNQTTEFKFLRNFGDQFASVPLDDPDAIDSATEAYNAMEATRQGFQNDAKFYRSIGADASARFKIMEHVGRFTVGDENTKTLAGIRAAAKAEELARTSPRKRLQSLPEGTLEEIDDATSEYLKENDRWYQFGFGSRRDPDLATSDFRSAVEAHYRHLRDVRRLTHEPALELAIEQTKGVSTLFDGSIVMTWGAAFPFGDSPRNIAKTLRNDPGIKKILAEHYSTGKTPHLSERPELRALYPDLEGHLAEPDWEQIRMTLDSETNSVIFLDRYNEPLHVTPIEHAVILNEANKQDLINMPNVIDALLDTSLYDDTTGEAWREEEERIIQNAR